MAEPQAQPSLADLQVALRAADRDADPVGWASLSLACASAADAAGGREAESIGYYRDALTVFSRANQADQWFIAALLLSYLLVAKRPAGPAGEPVLREAVGLLDGIIAAPEAAPAPGMLAPAVALRATALTQLAATDPTVVPAAVDAQRAAVAAAGTAAPDLAAEAGLQLAQLLIEHDGDQAEAIAALGQAVQFYTPEANTDSWLRCHWQLGVLLGRRAAGCAEVLAACAHLEQAASVKPPVVDEEFYSLVCRELSVLLPDQRCPFDEDRLSRAMAWSEQCLRYWPASDVGYRIDHARKLALAYAQRALRLGTAPDQQRAAALFDLAVSWAADSGASADEQIAMARDAACVYAEARVDQRENIETGITRLHALLDHWGDTMTPAVRADVLQSLGTAYQNRIEGGEAASLEQSRRYLEEALGAWDRAANPDQWASAANNLANTYNKRVLGDRGENLERAIELAEAAARIRTKEKSPLRWARTMHSLGIMYTGRVHGERAANLESAINRSDAALTVETRDEYPAEWSGAKRNLGYAYTLRVSGDRAENLRTAVRCFRDAIAVTGMLGDLKAHGDALLGLGQVLGLLGVLTRDGLVQEEAVATFEQATKAYAELGSADKLAAAWFVTANFLTELPGEESARRALAAASHCLPAWSAEQNPLRAPVLYRMLAQLHDQLGEAAEAYTWICQALTVGETLYAGANAEDSKIEIVADNAEWYRYAVDLALRTGAAASEALLLTERGRARMLRESSVRLEPDWAIPGDLLAQEAELTALRRRAWQWLTTIDPASDQVIDVSAQVQAATAELTSIWEQISAYPGGHQYVAARRGSSSWAEIRQWVDSQPAGFALLEYAVLFDRVAAFVVRPGRPEPTVVEIPLTQSALSQSYLALIREMDGSAAGRIRRETWDRTAAPLVTRVLPELRGTRLLCLVPHLLLHAMPLHALGEPGSTLLDQMAVYYAQSATLAAQLGRAPRRLRLDGGRPDALVVGDTLGDLAHAREEAVEVGRLLGVDPLTGEQATLAAVLPRLAQVELAHLACHGQLNTDVPALSSVVLADGLLTANQIQESGALRCDVLILSGCDTGYQPLQRTLEVGGLPSALLAAGARTAVGALWPVNDEATKELFISFFREFAGVGSAPGDTRDEVARSVPWCLRAAALALRQQRPERYFWAPFIAVGSW